MSWCGEAEARLEIVASDDAVDPDDDARGVVARIRAGSAQFAIML
jgi:hypothetical protein